MAPNRLFVIVAGLFLKAGRGDPFDFFELSVEIRDVFKTRFIRNSRNTIGPFT